jgi:hypothetical protein
MSDEEEQDESSVIYRTDGYWYSQAYNILSKFVQKLKLEIAFSRSELPADIVSVVTQMSEKDREKYKAMEEILRLLREYNRFINLELRQQLAKLGIQYDETDIYKNVVNYAKAKGINLLDDTILRNEVMVWLGTTDWNSNTGGRNEQMRKIKQAIRRMSAGGKFTKKYRKHSRNIKNSRKIKKSYRK